MKEETLQVRLATPNPYSVDQELLDALIRSLEHKSQIIVAYSSGSRQGQERPLTVLSLTPDGTAFTASEPNSDEVRTYIASRTLWITENNGKRTTNQKAVNRWNEYQSSLNASRRLLISGLTGNPSPNPPTYLVEQADSSGKIYKITHKETRLYATILARDMRAAIGIATLLDYIEERGGKGIWASIPGMIRHEFDWPDWRKYHIRVTQEARLLRNRDPEIKNISEYPDRKIRAAIENSRYTLYEKSIMRPPSDEGEYTYFKGKVRLFEATMPTLEPIRVAMAILENLAPADDQLQINDKAISTYLFSITPTEERLRNPIELTENFEEWKLLERAGLVSQLSEASPERLLILLPPKAILKPLRARKSIIGNPESNDIAGYLNLLGTLSTDDREEIITEIRFSSEAKNWWHCIPPIGWSYDELVDFRLLISEMLNELSAWLTDSSPNKRLARSLRKMS